MNITGYLSQTFSKPPPQSGMTVLPLSSQKKKSQTQPVRKCIFHSFKIWIFPLKCGLKLNLVSFIVDSLPSFNAVLIPYILYIVLYEAGTPTKGKRKNMNYSFIIFTHLFHVQCHSEVWSQLQHAMDRRHGKHSGQQCFNCANTNQYRVIVLCPLVCCLILLPNNGH